MPTKTSFPFRLVFDYDFYDKTIKEYTENNRSVRPPLLTKLMYINSNSKEHRRSHNIISPRTFNQILDNNESMPRSLLRSSFYPNTDPTEIEEIDDEIERNIKHAIDIALESPYKTVILTTPEKEETYSTNSHFIDVKTISVKSGTDAINLINTLWNKCA